ncbi:MAG: amidinotransferase, partial [Bacteroidetes bacterium]|nr:amidinotransferase [Bacteroidota bacterium]
DPICPDAVFPNNWLGVHPGGQVFLYQMQALSRRNEVRPELASMLADIYPGLIVTDLRYELDNKNQVLEGTGSMVFDHLQKTVYAAVSGRTSREAVIEIAAKLGYKPLVFHTMTPSGTPVYHTNVLLSIGTGFAIVASEVIHIDDREAVLAELRSTGRTIIEISLKQMECFAANALELRNSAGEKLIVISSTAVKSLEESQLAALQNHGLLLETDVPVIEQNGGGSVRCMLAEVFY